MITRVFRVKIKAELRDAFEPLFQSVSVESVKSARGFISLSIGKPMTATPDEYVMISNWESQQDLIGYVGPKWTEAHIPDGMEKFVQQCWVHHYLPF